MDTKSGRRAEEVSGTNDGAAVMTHWILGALLILSAAGCGRAPADGSSGTQYYAAANGPVEFAFPAGWYKNPKEHPFDLQLFSRQDRMNTGVFLFAKEDLAEDLSPRELFDRQIQDLGSKRKNFKVVEAERVVALAGKRLTSVVYSGEKGSSRDYYRFTLVEFAEAPGLIPVVLQVSTPSYWKENKPVLEAIAASARVTSVNSREHR
jgi:hypothetical protein